MPARAKAVQPAILYDEEDAMLVRSGPWTLSNGYPSRRRNGKLEYLHVLIMGTRPGFEVDHEDRNKLNARRSNLRFVAHQVNTQNLSLSARNSSGFRGVARRRNRWRAYATINGKQHTAGCFDTPEAAAAAATALRQAIMEGALS